MSNAEHAFENAISAIKRGETFEEWIKHESNLTHMCATGSEVWDMAQYCLTYFEEK